MRLPEQPVVPDKHSTSRPEHDPREPHNASGPPARPPRARRATRLACQPRETRNLVGERTPSGTLCRTPVDARLFLTAFENANV